ncbi:hypothetical protein Fcan01_00663 [Folsomia candida]|uniref:Uncharacterized protein n=1 Tax=Folsomia candida TaxID=158441 RepID=A0A226EY78_FOLCA|nr:hypothetical protein Fcan01_00663 [Folsomia candida]
MLSKRYFLVTGITNRVGLFFGSFPFKLNISERYLYIPDKVIRHGFRRLAIAIFYTSYLGIQAYLKKVEGGLTGFNFTVLFTYLGILLCISSTFFLIDAQGYCDTVNFSNNFISKNMSKTFFENLPRNLARSYFINYLANSSSPSLAKEVTENKIKTGKWFSTYNPETNLIGKLWDTFYTLMNLGALGSLVTSLLHYVLFPESPIYITSHIDTTHLTWKGNLLLFLTSTIFYFFAIGHAIWNGLMHGICILTYAFFVTPFVTQELCIGRRSYRSRPELRQIENLLPVYKSVELLHSITMKSYGAIIVPAQSIFGKVILLCFFMVVRHGGELIESSNYSLLLILTSLGCCMFIFWSVILRFGGYFYTRSIRTVRSWKLLTLSQAEKRYLAKVGKSCRPLRIGYPGYYKISNLSMLKFWQGMAKGVCRVLIAIV